MLNVLNPATGETIAEVPVATAEDVDRAVASARGAFTAWSNTTPAERQEALLKLADAVERHSDELAEIEARNAGKPLHAMREDEMPVCVDNLRFFAGAARNLEGKAAGEYLSTHTSWTRREAVGVVSQITPWNYPLMMAIWKIGPALATGNTIVLKPAESTPLSTLRLAELANEILPEGVLNVVTGAGEVGQRMVTHPDVDMVSLTGQRRHRQVDRAGRRGHAQARPPRARRQGARRGLRRRRPGAARGDDRRRRLLQRRPGLHGRDARARVRPHARRRRRGAGRAGPRAQARRHLRPRDHARPGQLRAPALKRHRLPRAPPRPHARRHRRQAGRRAPASSSSRP